MEKSELRKIYKAKRKEFSTTQINEFSSLILKQLIHSDLLKDTQNIHVFISSSALKEVNTQPIIEYLWANNKTTFVPKVIGNELITCLYNKETILQKSNWGILEPENPEITSESKIDLVITPLLTCDINGNRVGYGGGFYDKLFSKCSNDIKKVGINFFEPTSYSFPLFKTDSPLDFLITPSKVFEFN
ncbi:5-formyltetrahydrofolate cyclo-ligase [Weeksellaceae bacterium TAE3-ERU29]|nr:5-formyltetrahydrofolate cyclo-ligase [Weeksellaceae bacterium TAE3-ERU29]